MQILSNNENLLKITSEADNIRLDKYLTNLFPSWSRKTANKFIEDEKVFKEDQKSFLIDKSYKLKLSEVIYIDALSIDDYNKSTPNLAPKNIKLDIVFEDDHILVINKASGMVVHPGFNTQDNTLVHALMHCSSGKLAQSAGENRPGIVHRLDKDTSGLLIVAKTDEAYSLLSQALKDRTITRKYYALCHGIPSGIENVINISIAKDDNIFYKMKATNSSKAKHAITYFCVKKIFAQGKYSLVECKLDTGRTHQIRVHLSYVGSPIIGDSLYGTKKKQSLISSQALHAYYLSFDHPITGEFLEFEVPLPHDMIRLSEKLSNI